MYRSRCLYLSVAAVLVALAMAIPAQAGLPQRRGLSDFHVYKVPSAVPSTLSEQGHAPILRRGRADFGLSAGQISRLPNGQATSASSQSIGSVEPPRQGEFNWGDAGVGAGVAAGSRSFLARSWPSRAASAGVT